MTTVSDSFLTFINNLTYLLYPFVYIPFLFPFNCLYEYFTIYNPRLFKEENSPKVHKRKVERIQAQIQKWNKDGRKKRMCSARSAGKSLSVRNIDKSKFAQIQLDEMEDIIELDLENMINLSKISYRIFCKRNFKENFSPIVLNVSLSGNFPNYYCYHYHQVIKVEPGISMGTLTHKLLPLGVIIPIIPEFDTLTVGGLINGAGLETSSHKYGLFSTTCLEYEVVLADGTVVNCSEKKNSDLFYSMPMAYGTLGFMTSVTFPLITARKYVKLEYHAASNISEAYSLMKQTENEFIEGIAFTKEKSVIMLGNFTDTPEKDKINHINKWYKNWFYKHAEGFLNERNPVVEYLPTRDYYHRHTRSYFWTITQSAVTQSRIYIALFGWSFPPNYSFIKTVLPQPKFFIDFILSSNIIQDFIVPLDKLKESIELSDDLTGVYPLWFCPCKMYNRPGLIRCRGNKDTDYVDFGVYGPVCSEKRKRLGGDVNNAVKKFEQFTIKHTGFQGMYTDCFLSREDFDKMFDRTLYDKLRTELNCQDAFPDVYEKISITFKKN